MSSQMPEPAQPPAPEPTATPASAPGRRSFLRGMAGGVAGGVIAGGAAGAAASRDADAGDIRHQELRDRPSVEIGRRIAVPLRVTDTGGDGIAQGLRQRRVDSGEIWA